MNACSSACEVLQVSVSPLQAMRCFVNVQMAITALVASLNPAIVARQNSGFDSEEVRAF